MDSAKRTSLDKSDDPVSAESSKTQLTIESDVPKLVKAVYESSQGQRQQVPESNPRLAIRIPDVRTSIMASTPSVNPNYFKVRLEADRWISRIINFDEKMSAKITTADLCYLSSLWSPSADAEALRMVVDWTYWVFYFDDLFDEGQVKEDPIAAKKEVDAIMEIMTDDELKLEQDESRIRYAFQTIWARVKKRASPELQQRFKEQHKRYFDCLLEQVQRAARREVLATDVQAYMKMRRGTVAVGATIAICEISEGVNLPEQIYLHSSLQECIHVAEELVTLVNDLSSYKKDLRLGVPINIISILQDKGMSVQQSVDQIGIMINDCYRRWYTALAELPPYGEEIDREVLKFVEACRLVALGCLHWSFQTDRYLGPEGYEAHKTKTIYIPQ